MRYRMKTCKVSGRHYAHRVLWTTFNGPIPEGMQIDHINGDKQDNRLSNLRLVSNRENSMNVSKCHRNSSGLVGVHWETRRNKWLANAMIEGKTKYLGRFDDWFEAVCARMSANNLYGFHENHGRR